MFQVEREGRERETDRDLARFAYLVTSLRCIASLQPWGGSGLRERERERERGRERKRERERERERDRERGRGKKRMIESRRKR